MLIDLGDTFHEFHYVPLATLTKKKLNDHKSCFQSIRPVFEFPNACLQEFLGWNTFHPSWTHEMPEKPYLNLPGPSCASTLRSYKNSYGDHLLGDGLPDSDSSQAYPWSLLLDD